MESIGNSQTQEKDPRWLAFCRRHLETMLEHGVDRQGAHPSLMWHAQVRTPEATPLPGGGCSLYWDQPLLAAAHCFAELVGDVQFARSADEYVRGFTERCIARTGLLLWGPHYRFDPKRNTTVRDSSAEGRPPSPCNLETETGELHEIRPIPPAWELLWRINPAMTEEAILAAAQFQISDPLTGLFSRRANLGLYDADLATGGILVESLAWLVRHVEGDFPMQLARGVATYAFAGRHMGTGLLPRNPAGADESATTAGGETGLWAGCLVRAAALANEPIWTGLADEAMHAWLAHAFDSRTGSFFAAIDTRTGTPPGTAPLALNPWRPGDLALETAEACFLLYGETGDAEYADACRHWCTLLERSLPASAHPGVTAGQYGRAIHFLQACSEEWPDAGYDTLARRVADDAIATLWTGNMFRSATGTETCLSQEGPGYLLLALLYLHAERDPHMMGSGW